MIHPRKFLWSMILLIGAISLVSCGGGGGSSAPAPTQGTTVTKFAILDGAQEATAITTTATGAGSLTVDTGSGAVSGSFTVLSAPASTVLFAHVHDGAASGAPPIITLDNSGAGVWSVPATTPPLTTAQIASFTAGTLYFNLHTNDHQGGEIRGNINKTSATLYAHLDGNQEATPVVTSAAADGSLTVNADTGAVSGSFTITVAPASTILFAHVHDAAVSGAPPIITLDNSGGGVWSVPTTAPPFTAAQIASFLGGKLYFNLHTNDHQGGEIRGNIVLIAP